MWLVLIKPLNNNVLVEEKKNEDTKTAKGVIMPNMKNDTVKSTAKGIVTAVGSGICGEDGKLKPITNVSVGNVVYYKPYAATEVDGYVIVADTDILAVED